MRLRSIAQTALNTKIHKLPIAGQPIQAGMVVTFDRDLRVVKAHPAWSNPKRLGIALHDAAPEQPVRVSATFGTSAHGRGPKLYVISEV